MPDLAANMPISLAGFPIKDKMMRYNIFVPRLYNFCKSLGFEPGHIMPSRAFCSDENQGYPIILLTKHFGTFPFNHGRVGGVVAIGRHGPHAEHGKDLVIIQASHVGYDPVTKQFGEYHRKQTEHFDVTPTCGKVHHVINWYQDEYEFAKNNIYIHREGGQTYITIDNQLLRDDRDEGLFLHYDKLLQYDTGSDRIPVTILSTAKVYRVADALKAAIENSGRKIAENKVVIGESLTPDIFYFKKEFERDAEGEHDLERNLMKFMPAVVAAPSPLLTAAQISTQVEFDRTFRSIVKEHGYQGRKLVFISGLNIDISPKEDNMFPITKFVPWAAYVQNDDGSHKILEQDELVRVLAAQSTYNPDQIDLEDVIEKMSSAPEVKIIP